jgi:RNA polymerase-binding transcription factor DksA
MAYKEIARELEERLALLTRRLEGIKKDVTQSHSGDSSEQAQERENDEVVDAIGNETRQSLREVRAALDRIADETYGICEKCRGNIPLGRLQALPEATRCLKCAN